MSDLSDRLAAALVDRYTIEHELGRGGMATVYLAHDRKHDRNVALKVMRPELAAILGGERFLREIRIAAQLNHPHILALHDSGEADGFLYYVMPYVEGESLRAKIAREKQLAIDDALSIIRQIASALDYAHQQGVIHRDIKPENVLLHRGVAVVADFGIALAVTAAAGERLTETGLSLGTPEYMSPEQATGSGALDVRADVYSLGAVLYEMVVGEPPQTGATVQAVIAKLLSECPTRPRVIRQSVPEPMDGAIMKALAKVPADRFDTAGDFVTALTAQVAASEVDAKSIVVLPFENLSPDPENEYFSDGLTDELIADLSKLHSLRVISRNSAMQLKGTDKDTKTIGRDLNVRYVVEGTVRRAGKRLRITAQLIDAPSDGHLWTEKYDGVLEDVFDMQETISRTIVDALKVRLSPAEDRRIRVRPMSNVHAYECYLKARQEIWRATEESLDRARELLDDGWRAVGDNELLYAGKGSVSWQYVNNLLKPAGVYEGLITEAGEYAGKALALNADSAVGHVLKGQVCNNTGEPKEALRHFLRAVTIDASNPEALFWVGYVLAASENGPMSRQYFQRAVAVDPLTPLTQTMPTWLDFFEGRFGATVDPWCRMFSADPQNVAGRIWRAWILAVSGSVARASALLDGIVPDPSRPITGLGVFWKHALEGRREEALRAATPDVLEAARWDDLTSLQMAEGFALIGAPQQAIEWLDRTIRFGIASVPFFSKHDPFLESVRAEPRFAELMDLARNVSRDIGTEIESFAPPW